MNNLKFGGIFRIRCYNANGTLRWEDISENIVVDQGFYHILDALFVLDGEVPNANYYVGLTDSEPSISASDTLTTHTGWTEVTDYTETTRPEYVKLRTGQTVDNLISKAVFSINNTVTVGGIFITNANTGTTGMLLSAAAFSSGDKEVVNGNTLETEYIFAATGT